MQVLAVAQPLEDLANRTPSNGQLIAKWLAEHQRSVDQVRYLPIENQKQQDWVVLIQANNAQLLGYVALDGWR
jgi:O-acetylhomoserine/O-acetylserine sulfhydrylase-like pyridoxal-dependent enzyme